MVQLEIALSRQQRQLDELRQALKNVVDIAVHKTHKDQVLKTLANKANVEQLEEFERSQHQEAEKTGKQLFDALAKKADAMLFEEQQSLVQQTIGQISALEQQQEQVASSIADISSGQLQEQNEMAAVQRKLIALSSKHDKLTAVVEGKADCKVLEHQEQLLEGTQKDVTLLEERFMETIRQHVSASLTAEMKRETLERTNEAAFLKHREAVTAVKAQMEILEQKWLQRLESEMARVSQQQEQQEERLAAVSVQKARGEMNQLVQAYDERSRDHEASVTNRLDQKADVQWFEQHQRLLDAAQVSLAVLNKDQKELRIDIRAHLKHIMCEKVDHKTLQEHDVKVNTEIHKVQASLESANREMHTLAKEFSQMQAQMEKVMKRVDDIQASVATKASQSLLEQEQQASQALHDQVHAMMQQIKLVAYTQASMSMCPKDADANVGTLVHPPSCPRETMGLPDMPPLTGRARRSPYRNFKRR